MTHICEVCFQPSTQHHDPGFFSPRCCLGCRCEVVQTPDDLSERERLALIHLSIHSGREKHGDGPWERSWVKAANSAEGRAFASLARKGLIQTKGGHETAKIAPRYRWKAET